MGNLIEGQNGNRFRTPAYGTEPPIQENGRFAQKVERTNDTERDDGASVGSGKRLKVVVQVGEHYTADLTPGKHEVGKPL